MSTADVLYITMAGTLYKPQQQQKCHKTKGLISVKMAFHTL